MREHQTMSSELTAAIESVSAFLIDHSYGEDRDSLAASFDLILDAARAGEGLLNVERLSKALYATKLLEWERPDGSFVPWDAMSDKVRGFALGEGRRIVAQYAALQAAEYDKGNDDQPRKDDGEPTTPSTLAPDGN